MKKTKKCYKCLRRRSINSYAKNKTKYDGLNSMCKDCCREYQAKYVRTIRGKSVRYLSQKQYLKKVRRAKK